MLTSDNPKILAADLNRMSTQPVSLERAEQILSEEMAWLPEGEPQQCVVEDRYWDIQIGHGRYRLHRRTILSRQQGDRLQITAEVALLRPDGIEVERRAFAEPSGEIDAYFRDIHSRIEQG